MVRHGGDDLEDDFVPDDLVAMEEEEVAVYSADGEDASGLLSADEEAQERKDTHSPTKTENDKKRKRRAKEKERKKRRLAESLNPVEAPSVAAQSPMLLADYLSSMQAKAFSKMTSIELSDMQIPESSIVDTTQWVESRNLDRLVEFISKVLPTLHTRLSQRPKSSGSPTLIVVAGAALRVADITRALRDKRLRGEKGGEIAKLFAKHFKLKEHVAFLKRTKIAAAVGTPGRLGKLLCETDALSTSALTHVILDITYRDAKKRNLLDIPETRDEVFKDVLAATEIVQGLKQGKIHLVLL